ncbi:hypothetical protein Tco_0675737 [Tanacetum coccineum]
MASIFGSKSKSFMTMSIPPQDEPLTNQPMAISLPQDVPSTSARRLIELENQVQRLMEAHLAPKQPNQVNKSLRHVRSVMVPTTLGTTWKIPSKLLLIMRPRVPTKREASGTLSSPSKTTLVTPIIRHGKVTQTLGLVSNFMASQDARLSKFEADFKQQQSEMTNKIDTVLKAITDQITGALPSDTVKNPKQNVNSTSPVLFARSYPMEDPQCSTRTHSLINTITICPKQPNKSRGDRSEKEDTKFVCTKDDGDVMFIKIIRKYDDSHKERPEDEGDTTIEGLEVEYFDTFLTRSELAYHKRRKLDPREDPNRGVSYFTGRIKGMHVFIGNFTYVINFMIVEDISSIVDPRLSQVVLGKPFVKISNMTYDPSLGVVKFTDRINKIAYKMPHKIEQYDSLSDLEKEHTKSVYLRNEEDKRRGVEYVMRKILGFYKECIELGPEYSTGVAE